jgi:hypothetical protein
MLASFQEEGKIEEEKERRKSLDRIGESSGEHFL